MVSFWLRVFVRAIEGTLSSIGKEPHDLIFGGSVVALSVVVIVIRSGRKVGWRNLRGRVKTMLGEDAFVLSVLLLLVFTYHLYRAPYDLWHDQTDATHEAVYGADGRAAAWQQYTRCDKERAVDKALVERYSENLATQQTLLNTQQGTFDRCVLYLSQQNAPEPLKLTLLNMGNLKPDTKRGAHSISFLVLTNRTMTPFRGDFVCDHAIDYLDVSVVGSGAMIGGSGRLEFNLFRIEIQAPAFSPVSPLMVTLYYNEDDAGTCGIRNQFPTK
jgi:hypothetical protein